VALFEAGAVTLDGPGARLIVELPGLPEPPPLPGGFGLALIGRSDGLAVAAVLDTGPAAAAGIQPGDTVLAIDGTETRGWTPTQAWGALAGRNGAVFDVRRDDAPGRRVRLERRRFFPLLR
jgi:C-terminal processing protease CtpA/Prc